MCGDISKIINVWKLKVVILSALSMCILQHTIFAGVFFDRLFFAGIRTFFGGSSIDLQDAVLYNQLSTGLRLSRFFLSLRISALFFLCAEFSTLTKPDLNMRNRFAELL